MHIFLIVLGIIVVLLLIAFAFYIIIKPDDNFFDFIIDCIALDEIFDLIGSIIASIFE